METRKTVQLVENATKPGEFWALESCAVCGYVSEKAIRQCPCRVLVGGDWNKRVCNGKCSDDLKLRGLGARLDNGQ